MKAAPTSELRFEQRVWHLRIMHSDTLRIEGRETNKQCAIKSASRAPDICARPVALRSRPHATRLRMHQPWNAEHRLPRA